MKSTKILLIKFFIIVACTSIKAQYSIDTTRSGKPMLFGQVSEDAFRLTPFFGWYEKQYKEYEIDQSFLKKKSIAKVHKYDVTIFMGTWCGDSRKEVPRVLKVLKSTGFDMTKVTIHALNQLKQGVQREEKNKNIHRVPVIILSKNGKEKGRIIEHPVTSIEEDLAMIASSNKYVPHYYGLELLHRHITQNGWESITNEKLIKKLRQAIQHDYELSKFGRIYSRNQSYDKAHAIYDLNQILFPKSIRPIKSKGITYYQQGKLQQAKKNFEKILEQNPNDKYVINYLNNIKKNQEQRAKNKEPRTNN